ncbi:MAG: hypothetical protein WBQ25_12165, partial [Nitrososphaeraceae archaeon]
SAILKSETSCGASKSETWLIIVSETRTNMRIVRTMNILLSFFVVNRLFDTYNSKCYHAFTYY